MRNWRSGLVAAIAVIAWSATAGQAAGFGTIDGGGQNREHERITRAALACTAAGATPTDCFEARTMDSLAGHDRAFGAIGAPDRDELSLPAAHCDNADYVAGPYPRTRERQTAALLDCVDQMRMRFQEGVQSAGAILDADGAVRPEQVDLTAECDTGDAADTRAKCAAIEGFGRALHGVQDFYAHSNWADAADPARPIGPDNPPGMSMPGPSAVLDLRGSAPPPVPPELTTGCYALRDEVPGVGDCAGRATHAGLNKDRGLIDPISGGATQPTTARGMVGDNFAQAVAGAIAETGRQWQDFRAELAQRYGRPAADTIICAITHDDPVTACRAHPLRPVIGLVAALGAAAVVVALVIRRRRAPR